MWFKTVLSAVISMVMGSGCVASVADSGFPGPLKPSLVMHGDTSFTLEERGQIQEAAEIWRKQTSGLADLKVNWDYNVNDPKSVAEHMEDHVIVRLRSDDPQVVAIDCEASEESGFPKGVCIPAVLAWVAGGGIHGTSHNPVYLAFIPDRYPGHDVWVSVAIHEMGHVFGMPHSNVSSAVMAPFNDPRKMCLKQPDLASFCSVNVCTGYEMHPCE